MINQLVLELLILIVGLKPFFQASTIQQAHSST